MLFELRRTNVLKINSYNKLKKKNKTEQNKQFRTTLVIPITVKYVTQYLSIYIDKFGGIRFAFLIKNTLLF